MVRGRLWSWISFFFSPATCHWNTADRGDMSHGIRIAERGACCITEIRQMNWWDTSPYLFKFQIDSTANLGNLVTTTIHWLTAWMKGSSREILQRAPGKQSHSIVNRHSVVEICMTNTYVCWTIHGWIYIKQPTATWWLVPGTWLIPDSSKINRVWN